MKHCFPILLLFSFLLITGCRETNDMEDITSTIKERTFTVTASMPTDDVPSTRLVASQKAGSKNIELKWKEGDKIQLYFKSGEVIVKGAETQVKNISDDGGNAEFDVVVPPEVTGSFTLYGVHGAESVISEGTILLDARPSNLDQLGDISIPIYFEKEDLSSDFTATDVSFKHYGALQVLTFKNTANKKIALDTRNIDFSGGKWYYDVEDAEQPVYDIVSGTVLMKEASFSPVDPVSTTELSESDNLQLAQWIVPNGVTPPAVGLNLNIDGEGKTTASYKDARSEALKVGKAYHLYAVWNGDALDFTDEEAVQAYKMTMTTTIPSESTINLAIDAAAADKGDVWADWNNNGQKDTGEAVTKFGINNRQGYTINSQSFTIYGKVTIFTCSYQSITSLDVTKNTALTELRCGENPLHSLDVTKNTALTYLDCNRNSLTSLDVTNNIALTKLICYSNSFTSLNVTNNTVLTSLSCSSNKITSLDLTKNTKLTELSCGSNSFTSLNVTNNTALTTLLCLNNEITSLDLTKNTALTTLYCGDNPLRLLDVTNNTALTTLSCNDNKLTSLDVRNNTALTELSCFNNKLDSLNVTNNRALTTLHCHQSSLITLDITNNTALTELYCYNNMLTALDVSKCTALNHLNFFNNKLTALDVSNCTALNFLDCHENMLTALDVSKCTALNELCCYNNMLKALDVSNTALNELRCYFNAISGPAMDTLISGLPTWPESSKGTIYVFSPGYTSEKNVCTKAQVATASGKGWDVKTIFDTAYPGSE